MVFNRHRSHGFTLVELLVGTAILILLLTLLLGVVNQTNSAVKRTTANVDSLQQGRLAFDILNHTLSQATLNSYWDYYNAADQRRTPANASTFVPAKYGRASDLHFLIRSSGTSGNGQAVFFQSPQALSSNGQQAQTQGLLNACGYFVEFNDGKSYVPSTFAPQARPRYRLMQAIQTTEDLKVFQDPTAAWADTTALLKWPIAANVIALIVWPRLPVAEDSTGKVVSSNYLYDSRSTSGLQKAQLPPIVQLTMVVIDEASAIRLESGSAEPTVIKQALAGKFSDPAKYSDDLDKLESALAAARINYHTLTTTVTLRESRWSVQ